MAAKLTVRYKGIIYKWDGSNWYDSKTFSHPPEVVRRRLDAVRDEKLKDYDQLIDKLSLITQPSFSLVRKAATMLDKKQYTRAEVLARRILEVYPGNSGALAVLCSALRNRGRPRQALDETDAYRHKNFPELLTSRAAAWCDLQQYDKAKEEVGRALAMKQSQEAFNVASRIKSKRPDLYKKRAEF